MMLKSKSIWKKLWTDTDKEVSISLSVVILLYFSVSEPSVFFEYEVSAIICVTTAIAFYLSEKNYYPLSDSLIILGMPISLVLTATGLVTYFSAFTDVTDELPDVRGIGAATHLMLVTILCGLVLGLMGFILKKDKASKSPNLPIPLRPFLALLFIFLLYVTYVVYETFGFSRLVSIYPATLTIGLTFLFLVVRRQTGTAENLSDAGLATVIMGIIISTTELYHNFGSSDDYQFLEPHLFFQITTYANYCLFYGASIYVISFLWSLKTNETENINFKLRNWHMLEAFSFYVFMTLAAPSVFSLV